MPKQNAFTWIELLVVIAIILMLIGLLFPAFRDQRENGRCARCIDNMARIGVAMKNYHDHFGSFPPAYTVDEAGKPLHSWRTFNIYSMSLPIFAGLLLAKLT